MTIRQLFEKVYGDKLGIVESGIGFKWDIENSRYCLNPHNIFDQNDDDVQSINRDFKMFSRGYKEARKLKNNC